MNNRITELFGIKYPIIQGGMIWCSGWKLVSAVSNSGGLGLLGAGSMYPETLREHIRKTKQATDKPFGVNIPLIYPNMEEALQIVIEEGVKIVFTSAGSPKRWTKTLQDQGITVTHVVSNAQFAEKCQAAGVDAIVAEGFEAGGHNGREETTTLTLIPLMRRVTDLPLIAAGGIASGQAMLASMILGADGVQIGSRFAASVESSAHIHFKDEIVKTGEGETFLSLKQLTPARLIKNSFFEQVQAAEQRGVSREALQALLGRGRAKQGMFEGDLEEGELEIGQVAALIDEIAPVAQIMATIVAEYLTVKKQIAQDSSKFQLETF
jgi:enoyl-[acyl-carrier protein] reductase II